MSVFQRCIFQEEKDILSEPKDSVFQDTLHSVLQDQSMPFKIRSERKKPVYLDK